MGTFYFATYNCVSVHSSIVLFEGMGEGGGGGGGVWL